jgi:hypothetical protein
LCGFGRVSNQFLNRERRLFFGQVCYNVHQCSMVCGDVRANSLSHTVEHDPCLLSNNYEMLSGRGL